MQGSTLGFEGAPPEDCKIAAAEEEEQEDKMRKKTTQGADEM